MDTLLQIIHGYFTSNNVVFTAREDSINNTLKVYVLQASLYEIYRFTYVALRKLFKFWRQKRVKALHQRNICLMWNNLAKMSCICLKVKPDVQVTIHTTSCIYDVKPVSSNWFRTMTFLSQWLEELNGGSKFVKPFYITRRQVQVDRGWNHIWHITTLGCVLVEGVLLQRFFSKPKLPYLRH